MERERGSDARITNGATAVMRCRSGQGSTQQPTTVVTHCGLTTGNTQEPIHERFASKRLTSPCQRKATTTRDHLPHRHFFHFLPWRSPSGREVLVPRSIVADTCGGNSHDRVRTFLFSRRPQKI